MKRFRKLPNPAMMVAVIALVVALGGTAVAAKKLGLGALSSKAKQKTVGVGKLTYVNVQQTYNTSPNPDDGHKLTAVCPSNTKVLGGGTRLLSPGYGVVTNYFIIQEYPSTTGFTSNFFAGTNAQAVTVQVTAVCGVSQAVTGSPPAA
jgi:hypothetical protein